MVRQHLARHRAGLQAESFGWCLLLLA